MRPFRHVVILCGNAVVADRSRTRTRCCRRPIRVWSEGSWKGLADGTPEMPRTTRPRGEMLGGTENKLLGDADRVCLRWPRVRHRRFVLQDGCRRVLRRRTGVKHAIRTSTVRGGAQRLHRLWRLHGRLPAWREEHTRSELSVSRGEARREGARRDPRDRARAARGGWTATTCMSRNRRHVCSSTSA